MFWCLQNQRQCFGEKKKNHWLSIKARVPGSGRWKHDYCSQRNINQQLHYLPRTTIRIRKHHRKQSVLCKADGFTLITSSFSPTRLMTRRTVWGGCGDGCSVVSETLVFLNHSDSLYDYIQRLKRGVMKLLWCFFSYSRCRRLVKLTLQPRNHTRRVPKPSRLSLRLLPEATKRSNEVLVNAFLFVVQKASKTNTKAITRTPKPPGLSLRLIRHYSKE